MAGGFSRRDAERFNDLLEADRSRTHNDLSPLLTLTQRLNVVGNTVRADDEFAARCRTRLMAVAAVQDLGNEAVARPQGWRRDYQGLRRQIGSPRRVPRRLALLSGTLAALLGLSSMGMASGGAMPGDALYGMKLRGEAMQLAFARSDVSRGQLHLEFARNRLNEAQSIGSAAGIDSALDDADADTRSAMRDLGGAAMGQESAAPLDAVDQFVSTQRQDLQSWMDELSPDKRARSAESLAVLDQVEQRSQGLRSDLACSNGAAGNGTTDELGPLPGGCAAAPATDDKKLDTPSGTSEPSRQPTAPGTPTTGAPPSTAGSAQAPAPTPSQGPSREQPLLEGPSSSPAGEQQTGTPEDPVGDFLGGIFTPR